MCEPHKSLSMGHRAPPHSQHLSALPHPSKERDFLQNLLLPWFWLWLLLFFLWKEPKNRTGIMLFLLEEAKSEQCFSLTWGNAQHAVNPRRSRSHAGTCMCCTSNRDCVWTHIAPRLISHLGVTSFTGEFYSAG